MSSLAQIRLFIWSTLIAVPVAVMAVIALIVQRFTRKGGR